MIVPVRLWIIERRLSSPMRPVHTSRSLMTPCCWRSAIQHVVRTSSEVQNGSSTMIISRLLVRTGRVAIRYEIG